MPKIEQQPVMFGPQNLDVDAQVQICPYNPSFIGLEIKACPGLSGNFLTVADSAGTTLVAITSAGHLSASQIIYSSTVISAATTMCAAYMCASDTIRTYGNLIVATTVSASNTTASSLYTATLTAGTARVTTSFCAANVTASVKGYFVAASADSLYATTFTAGTVGVTTTLCAASLTASTTLNVYGAAVASAITLTAAHDIKVVSFGMSSISGEKGTSCKFTFPLGYSVFLLDGATSGLTGMLPRAAVGTTFFIKKVDATAAAANLATVVSGDGGSVTIDGAAQHVFAQGEGYLNVICTCANSTYACIGSGA